MRYSIYDMQTNNHLGYIEANSVDDAELKFYLEFNLESSDSIYALTDDYSKPELTGETKLVLVTSDFYSEYELYRTSDVEDLKEYFRKLLKEENVDPDPAKHELIGNQDDIWNIRPFLKIIDEVFYIYDFEEDDEGELEA